MSPAGASSLPLLIDPFILEKHSSSTSMCLAGVMLSPKVGILVVLLMPFPAQPYGTQGLAGCVTHPDVLCRQMQALFVGLVTEIFFDCVGLTQ